MPRFKIAKPRIATLRRASQIVFLALFVFLLVRTEFGGTIGTGSDIRMRWPVRLFFELDPLAALSNALIYRKTKISFPGLGQGI